MSAVLDARPAARYIAEHGWTQGRMYAPDGSVCLTGGLLKACQPGDAHLLVQVYRFWGITEDWNDEDGRTKDEVLAVLDRDVTEADLAATFGPQWEPIVGLVRRAAALTSDETNALAAAWASDAAWDATWDATWDAASDVKRAAAWYAAWAVARVAAWAAARDTVRGTALALVVRDLIGQHGFTQQHYDLLTTPWRQVIGPVHPDDAVTA